MTLAKRFIAKAIELVPEHDQLQKLDTNMDDASEIDRHFFRQSEFLGGLATAILSVLAREDRDAPTDTLATEKQFEDALRRVLGDAQYEQFSKAGFTATDFCREVAQKAFLGNIDSQNDKKADINLIRFVALRLWKGDGKSGLRK